jgi:hypothetical protein
MSEEEEDEEDSLVIPVGEEETLAREDSKITPLAKVSLFLFVCLSVSPLFQPRSSFRCVFCPHAPLLPSLAL